MLICSLSMLINIDCISNNGFERFDDALLTMSIIQIQCNRFT